MSSQPTRSPQWLDGYVGVDEAMKAFRDKYPDARIITNIVEGYDKLTFRADIYLPENSGTIPNSSGHASVDGGGGKRSQSPVEKTEAAAIRRALKWLGYGGKDEEDEHPPAQHDRPQPARVTRPDEEEHDELDTQIRQVFVTKGNEIQKLRPMINKRYEVEDGLNSLSLDNKREVLARLKSS